MKKLALTAIASGLYLMACCQKHGRLLVEYLWEQKSFSSALPDSEITKSVDSYVYTIRDGDTTGVDTIPFNLSDLLGSASLTVKFYMLSDDRMSKTFYQMNNAAAVETEGNSSITAAVNFPADTIYFDRSKWYEIRGGVKREISPAELAYPDVAFVRTTEKKTILGYPCFRFVSGGAEKGLGFWATRALPATLIPLAGLKSFGYGILEFDNPAKGIVARAVKISRL